MDHSVSPVHNADGWLRAVPGTTTCICDLDTNCHNLFLSHQRLQTLIQNSLVCHGDSSRPIPAMPLYSDSASCDFLWSGTSPEVMVFGQSPTWTTQVHLYVMKCIKQFTAQIEMPSLCVNNITLKGTTGSRYLERIRVWWNHHTISQA